MLSICFMNSLNPNKIIMTHFHYQRWTIMYLQRALMIDRTLLVISCLVPQRKITKTHGNTAYLLLLVVLWINNVSQMFMNLLGLNKKATSLLHILCTEFNYNVVLTKTHFNGSQVFQSFLIVNWQKLTWIFLIKLLTNIWIYQKELLSYFWSSLRKCFSKDSEIRHDQNAY
jgi:hypothetical protein